MIIVMKKGAKKSSIKHVISQIEKAKLKPVPLYGTERTVIAIIGDERILHKDTLMAFPEVEKVMEVLKPYKLASKEGKKSSKVRVGDVVIGGKDIVIMAGPCAVENEKQILNIAKSVKKSGAKILRGGAFKPRTGPYNFQGLREKGLKLLAKARKKTGLKIVTEVLDPRDVKLVSRYTDILQIGTRNMQNYPLLREAGKTKMPVLLKRGMWANYKELLLAAEYIMSQGNREVILCERGVRTFEKYLQAFNAACFSFAPLSPLSFQCSIILALSRKYRTYFPEIIGFFTSKNNKTTFSSEPPHPSRIKKNADSNGTF